MQLAHLAAARDEQGFSNAAWAHGRTEDVFQSEKRLPIGQLDA